MSDSPDIADTSTTTDRGFLIVMYRLPRCPHCGTTKHRARRTKQNEDGTLLRYTTCKACKKNFGIIFE